MMRSADFYFSLQVCQRIRNCEMEISNDSVLFPPDAEPG